MKYHYGCETVSGNFHSAVAFLNEFHRDWDVITMEVVGNYTMIVYRTEWIDYRPERQL